MLLDKITFATGWVNLVNIQVSIGAGDEEIDFSSNFMDSTKMTRMNPCTKANLMFLSPQECNFAVAKPLPC